MKKLCAFVIALTFLSLTLSPSLFAKKKDIVITLEATDIIKGHSAFNQVQVIDARKDKSKLGHTYENTKKRLIITRDSLAANVFQLVQSMLLGADKETDRELLIVIRDLSLHGQLISNILVDIDFYLGSNSQYRYAGNLDSLYEIYAARYGLNMLFSVTGYLITEKVKEIAAIQDLPATPGLSLTNILTQEDELKRSIIPYHHTARRGIYYTYEQFRNNTPADTFIHHERYFDGKAHVDRFYFSSLKKKKDRDVADIDCFAIYDDGKWYKRYTENTFREMKLTDGDFYYYDIARGLKIPDNTAIGYAAVPFSTLEIMAIRGLEQSLTEKQKRTLPLYEDAFFRMKLDPETGLAKKQERIP